MRYHDSCYTLLAIRAVPLIDGRLAAGYILLSTNVIGFNKRWLGYYPIERTREEITCRYASIPKLPISPPKPRRAPSIFMNGLATAGPFCFRIPKISRRCARQSWATWPG